MRKIMTIAALLAVSTVSTAAFAEDEAAVTTASTSSVEIKKGKSVYGADGKRIGRIYQVNSEGDAQIIYNLSLLTVPASTISSADGKLVSTLSLSDLRK